MYYQLTDHFQVAADLEKSWVFFSTAANLSAITPPWLAFTIHPSTPAVITADSVLDYTLRWAGVPVRWRSKIIEWSPPRQFIDLQVRGPYTLWHHQHTFTPAADGDGVVCFDRVIYKIPLGPVGRVTHALAVRRQLLDIFNHRRRVIGEHLGWVRGLQDEPRIAPL